MIQMDYKRPTADFLRSINVTDILPQREPFVMIQKLIYFDETRTITETRIEEDNLFVDNGSFSASGLIENIAQTCAARIGYVNKYILKKGIQIGFIGAIRGLVIYDIPKVGDVITTSVEVLEDVFGMTLAKAQITSLNKILVETEMKIAVKSDDNEE